ncbi:MAG: hypothetical protein Q8R98_15295 [Rubrivivax sp.]|nr:hypothetical protein [Rubrivivax sp.]
MIINLFLRELGILEAGEAFFVIEQDLYYDTGTRTVRRENASPLEMFESSEAAQAWMATNPVQRPNAFSRGAKIVTSLLRPVITQIASMFRSLTDPIENFWLSRQADAEYELYLQRQADGFYDR